MYIPTGALPLAAAAGSLQNTPTFNPYSANNQDASLAAAWGPDAATFAPTETTYQDPNAPLCSLTLASAIIASQSSQPINPVPVPPHQEAPFTQDSAPTNDEFVAATADNLVAFVLAQAHLHSCQARAGSSATQLQFDWDTCAILTSVSTKLGFVASNLFATCAMADEAPLNLTAAPMMLPDATTSTATPVLPAGPATLLVPAASMAVPSASVSRPLLASVHVPANVELLSAANEGDNDISYPSIFKKQKTSIKWKLIAENKVFKTIECNQEQGSEGQAGDEEHDSDDDDDDGDDDETEGGDPGQSQGGADSNSTSAKAKPKLAKKIHLRKFLLNMLLQVQASGSQPASEHPYVALLFEHTDALDAVPDQDLLDMAAGKKLLDSVTAEMLVSACHGCVDLANTQPILPLRELYAQYGKYRLVVSVGGVLVTGIPKMLRLYSYKTRERYDKALAEASAATSTVSSSVPNAPPSPPLTPTLGPLPQHFALPPSTAAAKKRASAKRKAPSQSVPGSQDLPKAKKPRTSSKPRAVATTECTAAAKRTTTTTAKRTTTAAAKRARKP